MWRQIVLQIAYFDDAFVILLLKKFTKNHFIKISLINY